MTSDKLWSLVKIPPANTHWAHAALPHQYPLSRLVEQLLRRNAGLPVRTNELRQFHSLSAQLSRECPDWQAQAMAALASLRGTPAPEHHLLSALLAERDLREPEPLLAILRDPAGPVPRRLLCAVALLGTQGALVSECFREALLEDTLAEEEKPQSQRAFQPLVFVCFVKLLLEGALSYELFRRAVLGGLVLDPALSRGRRLSQGRYHPQLDYLGLTDCAEFMLPYQRLIYELAGAGRTPSWPRISWARAFIGPEYFYRALEELREQPTPLTLLMLRWAHRFGEEEPDFGRRLSGLANHHLLLLNCLRPDLDQPIADVLQVPHHHEAMAWLRGSDRGEFPHELADWAQVCGAAYDRALLILQQMEQISELTPEGWSPMEFVEVHFIPAIRKLVSHQPVLWALTGRCLDSLRARAEEGEVSAIRAAGLVTEEDEHWAEWLLRLQSAGGKRGEASEQALAQIARRHGLESVEQLRQRLEMAAAWSDAGLEGQPARAWPHIGGYSVKLSITSGKVKVTAYGQRGPLRSIPRSVRAAPIFAEVRTAREELTKRYERFRKRLETAMVNGLPYPGRHFRLLLANPVFRNLAERLVLRGDGREVMLSGGKEGLSPREESASALVERAEEIEIAHPCSLLAAGSLDWWQERLTEERVAQPFKQCFRELYLPSPEELAGESSLRFAGHLVRPLQAGALLRTRGWSPGGGRAKRKWLPSGLHARFSWALHVPDLGRRVFGRGEDDPVPTGEIGFTGSDHRAVPLSEVPPVVYSETMRDVDLVVSIAAAGELGFTSEQTLQMRAALVKRFARMLGLNNVFVGEDHTHAIIEGQRAKYRLHLGSGSVFLEPEGRHLALSAAKPAPLEQGPVEEADTRTTYILSLIPLLSRDLVA